MTKHSTRRLTVFGAATIAAAMAVTSVAWACTTPEGATFFTNGKVAQTVAAGTRISAYAIGAPTGVGLKLVLGSEGLHDTHACMDTDFTVNNTPRFATSDGFIPPTAGPAGNATTPAGVYQVCFKDYVNGSVATGAATLTIL